MYLVTITNPDGSTIIHAPDASSIKLKTGSGKISVNAVPSFDFSMLPDNPGYGLMKPLVTRVRVVRTDLQRIKFDGRILRPVNDMADSGLITRSFTCEDVIAYLHDGLPGYTTLTGTWQEVIAAALKAYNSLVEDWKQIKPGKISDGGSLTVKTSPEMDWYDTLYKLVVTDHSYEWRIRTGDDNVHYLDVASQIGEVKDAPRIELAYNLKSMSVEADATNVISRVYPLGAVKQTDSTSTTTTTDEVQERVNLGDIGKPLYIDSPDLIAEYGIQPGKQIFDTITDANELPAKATAYLKAERPVTTKFTASALDLSTIGLDVDEFEAYNYYPVYNPLQSIDEPLRVTEQAFDINSPQTAALSFGDRMKRQSDFALESLQVAQTAQVQAATARTVATKASAEAKTASETATTALDTANSASDAVAQASANAKTAVATATKAQTQANTATANAETAQTAANKAQSTIDNLQVGATNLVDKGEIASYDRATTVDRTYFSDHGSVTITRGAITHSGVYVFMQTSMLPSRTYTLAWSLKYVSGTLDHVFLFNPFTGIKISKAVVDGKALADPTTLCGGAGAATVNFADKAVHTFVVTFATPADILTQAPSYKGFILQPEKNTATAYSAVLSRVKPELGVVATDWSMSMNDIYDVFNTITGRLQAVENKLK